MLRLYKNQVPSYLRESELFGSLSEDGNGQEDSFDVPEAHCKMTPEVETAQDLDHLLSTIRYWGLAKYPDSLYKSVLGGIRCDEESLVAEYGDQITILKSLFIVRKEPTLMDKIKSSIRLCSLELLKVVIKEDQTTAILSGADEYVSLAAELGYLEILRYLSRFFAKMDSTEDGINMRASAIRSAALNGQLECLKFAVKYNLNSVNEIDCTHAAMGGNVDCLAYIHEHGKVTLTGMMSDCAAAYGRLNCLVYLNRHGCPWHRATGLAAKHGHLECLIYAFENGCQWHETDECTFAAAGGYLNCLQYAYEHGANWDEETTKEAAAFNHYECLKYCVENGCPVTSHDHAVYLQHCNPAGNIS